MENKNLLVDELEKYSHLNAVGEVTEMIYKGTHEDNE